MLKPRERRLILVAVLLGGCWGALSWLLEPLWHRDGELTTRVDQQTQKLEALSRTVERSSLIERRYQQISPYISDFSQEQNKGLLLNELETFSRKLSLQLNLKPRPATRQNAKTFDVEVDLEGTQKQILSFIDQVLAMPQLIAVQRMSVSAVPTRPDRLRANLIIQQIHL